MIQNPSTKQNVSSWRGVMKIGIYLHKTGGREFWIETDSIPSAKFYPSLRSDVLFQSPAFYLCPSVNHFVSLEILCVFALNASSVCPLQPRQFPWWLQIALEFKVIFGHYKGSLFCTLTPTQCEEIKKTPKVISSANYNNCVVLPQSQCACL